LGLDPVYLQVAQTAVYRDMERVCSLCKAWRRCMRDLANGDVQVGMSRYCLNAFTLDSLLCDAPRTPKLSAAHAGAAGNGPPRAAIERVGAFPLPSRG
jgi:hypothetical protein